MSRTVVPNEPPRPRRALKVLAVVFGVLGYESIVHWLLVSGRAAGLGPIFAFAPLLLIGAWLLVFIPATRELSTAMFLYGPKTRTMSVMLMDMSEEGNFEHLAALGFLLLASTLIIVGLASSLLGRDFMLRRERG